VVVGSWQNTLFGLQDFIFDLYVNQYTNGLKLGRDLELDLRTVLEIKVQNQPYLELEIDSLIDPRIINPEHE
jgi:hypothetical protein